MFIENMNNVLKARARTTASLLISWRDRVIPVRVEITSLDVQACHLCIGDFEAFWIGVGIQLAGDGEAGGCGAAQAAS